MKDRLGIFGLSIAALASVLACTTTTTTTTEKPAENDAGSSTASHEDASSSRGEEDDAGSIATDPDEQCPREKTAQACIGCCLDNHPQGAAAQTARLIACACEGTGSDADGGEPPCADACADTVCAATPTAADAACEQCLKTAVRQGGACVAFMVEACSKEEDCVANQKCLQTCPD